MLVVVAILSMVATAAWSQTIIIPTDTKNGWTINNSSTFQVNTWSTEGSSDGTGMTTPFLENWVYRSSKLPAGTWSYKVTGLEPNSKYLFSAFVRVCNEGSYTDPGDACQLYAGDAQVSVSTCETYSSTIGGQRNTGRYGTISVIGETNASGELTVGLYVTANKCNWIAMKDAILSYMGDASITANSSDYAFVRINGASNITSGSKYLVVYQTSDAATSGYALDGSKSSSSKNSVSIKDNTIRADESSAFTFTEKNNGYSVRGVGSSYYLYLYNTSNFYSKGIATSLLVEGDNTVTIKNNSRKNYLRFDSNQNFITSSSVSNLSLYQQVSLSFSADYYETTINPYNTNLSSKPTLTKVPSNLVVTYSSSDTDVATIDASTGEISLKKGGMTTITASYGSVSASYVLVVKKAMQSDFTFSLNGQSPLSTGSSYTTGCYNNQGEVTYESSNTSIATIDKDGVIHAKRAGTVRMTATAAETDMYYPAVKTITITTEGEDALPGLTFAAAGNVSTITATQVLNTVATYNGNGAVSYASSDNQVATIDANGKIVGVNSGTVTLTATVAESDSYISESKSITITVTKNNPNLQFMAEGNATTVARSQELRTQYSRDGQGVVTFKSSDTSVATINALGVIVGVKEGTVTLTASVAETDTYQSATKSITIQVTAKDPGLAFSTEGGVTQIPVGDQLKTKSSVLSGATITYSTSNSSVASIDSKGVIKGEGLGTATLTATVAAEGEYRGATKTLTVQVVKHSTTVEPSFSTKSVRVGGTTVLKLLTNSNGNQHFSSSNPAVATINATTGEIAGVAEGTATISYWIDASEDYEAFARQTVTVAVSNKLEPVVEFSPSVVSLAIGGRKEVTIELGDYAGTCSVVMNNSQIATVSEKSHDVDNHIYVYSVSGVRSGETFLTLQLEETNDYMAKEITVPVNVQNSYQYELVLVNAPDNGVAVQIWGVTYTSDVIFNSSHSSIVETDVNVHYLPSYDAEILIDGHNITVTYSLREAVKGTFFRLKSYSCGKYATLSADGSALGVAERGMDNIIYYDEEGHFLFYNNGKFVKNVNKMATVAEASSASVFSFVRGTGNYSDGYVIKSGSQYLLGSASGTTIGSAAGSEYAYWYVEMLESLPVRVSDAGYGYATLYSPVELEVAGGLSAYYVDSKTDWHDATHVGVVENSLHLEPLLSVIPAKTPVILVGIPGTTYDCVIRGEQLHTAPVSEPTLTGNFSAQVSSDLRGGGTLYVLQPSSAGGTVGFYPWEKDELSGFKCYFVEKNPSPAPSYRLTFGEVEESNGLNELLIETNGDSSVFDLQGQRVGDTIENLPAGLYVVGGRKIIIR